ncbi:MerR family transcriptional regulator [Streptomyces pacificus]|uniref:MerR family transcriptional regulator n=1 Tax=Streptomyces pacificus TaxID=2705029 RepID=A0A6A0B1Z0_9ACTN|nr:MerR family transcriptional regulator [Streptomyces pacificus]GFH38695.1 MerR family transcriptional regulator [Streptomyces pacificus]
MSGTQAVEYRIEDLAHHSGATVRTIRAYQDRGLLPRPERRGRSNVYGESHLARLLRIAGLLDRGYTLASIKELLEAWDAGRGLGGVLGFSAEARADERLAAPAAECHGLSAGEKADRISRSELAAAFGDEPGEAAIAEVVELGVLERVPGGEAEFLVRSPQELAVAAELSTAGVPLAAITGQLRELHGHVEHIVAHLREFIPRRNLARCPGRRPSAGGDAASPPEADGAVCASAGRRSRPLTEPAFDAELDGAMRFFAVRQLRYHLAAGTPREGDGDQCQVALPGGTIRAVERLVGSDRIAAFITAAAEREVHQRALHAMTTRHPDCRRVGQGACIRGQLSTD